MGFDKRVVDIFYDGLTVERTDPQHLRNTHLAFPKDCPKVLLLGVPGAGKTTLGRQLIGTHPVLERFPSTSVNRTTTCETEIIVGTDGYAAVVTFLSEEEADFEVRQSVSAALLKAIESDLDSAVSKAFLDRSDMRFRLKYVLGDLGVATEESNPYASAEDIELTEQSEDSQLRVSLHEAKGMSERLVGFIQSIRTIAASSKARIQKRLGPLESLSQDERNAALDDIQELAENSDEYGALVSDILDELRCKFDSIPSEGFHRSTTGWPKLWSMTAPANNRTQFLTAVRAFTGIDKGHWGKLLTPLVNGIRVAGPFVPSCRTFDTRPRVVLIDTEGLGHKADATFDVPDYIIGRFAEVDVILMVDGATVDPMSRAAARALEVIGSAGQTSKLCLAFTHMDEVKGPNIRGWEAMKEYTFNSVRNVFDNQIAKSLTPHVARHMLSHLEKNTFYLGSLQRNAPAAAMPELEKLLLRLEAAAAPALTTALPRYNYDWLMPIIIEGVSEFRNRWKAYLNLPSPADVKPLPWQSVKAVARRYGEGYDDGYHIRPASNLLNALSVALSRFLENPREWEGNPSLEEKRAIVDRLKEDVTDQLTRFCAEQLRGRPRIKWLEAYALRGDGTTYDRKLKVEAIYERWVPVPRVDGDEYVLDFAESLRTLVVSAIDVAKQRAQAQLASAA